MMHKSRRKIKRKYKRLAAAVAGAAIMSSAMLPAISPAVAHASPDPNTTAIPNFTTTTSTANPTITADPTPTPAPTSTPTDLSAQRKHRDRNRDRDRDHHDRNYRDKNPVYQYYSNVTVTTALDNQPVVPQTLAASQQVLFQSANYDTWSWNESTYPQEMTFGVFLRNPLQNGLSTPIPKNVLSTFNNVNFGNQFIIYAHLGTKLSPGHAIGISRVVQNGNDLTVTVRTNSPQPNNALGPTKADDLVQIDRATLNFAVPINITFVNENGTILNNYTINPS